MEHVGHFSAAMKVRSGLVTADDETHDENRSASMKRDEQLSPDRHFSFVFLFISENVLMLDLLIGP
jgi:hypothetical protein